VLASPTKLNNSQRARARTNRLVVDPICRRPRRRRRHKHTHTHTQPIAHHLFPFSPKTTFCSFFQCVHGVDGFGSFFFSFSSAGKLHATDATIRSPSPFSQACQHLDLTRCLAPPPSRSGRLRVTTTVHTTIASRLSAATIIARRLLGSTRPLAVVGQRRGPVAQSLGIPCPSAIATTSTDAT
jgi:hypothetical protein